MTAGVLHLHSSHLCLRRSKTGHHAVHGRWAGHMDTFDPKPELTSRHKEESKLPGGLAKGYKFFVGSPFGFQHAGDNGIQMCDQWKYMADPYVANELCNYRGCQAESLNHPEALFHMNTGSRLGAIQQSVRGSRTDWAENENLPAFVVMTDELALRRVARQTGRTGFFHHIIKEPDCVRRDRLCLISKHQRTECQRNRKE